MKKSGAVKLVAILRAAYPDGSFPADSVALYAQFLEDFDEDVARRAIEKFVATDEREVRLIPAIGTLRSIIVETADPLPDTERAWEEVERAIRSRGRDRMPEWSNPTIAVAVSVLGWRNLCVSENLVADRAHFFKVFDSIRKRELDKRNIDSLNRTVPLVDASAARQRLGPATISEVIPGIVGEKVETAKP